MRHEIGFRKFLTEQCSNARKKVSLTFRGNLMKYIKGKLMHILKTSLYIEVHIKTVP